MLRALLALCWLVLATLIVYAIQFGDFWLAGAWLTSDPWGLTSLVDLYLGLAICAVIVALYERGWSRVFWATPILFLGNVWTVIWLIFRLPELAKKMRS